MKKLYKIKKSRIDNRGLYAALDIKKNTKIIEYKGKIITVKETEKLVNLVFLEITHALTEGKRIELRGFGTLSVKSRLPRKARNPKTGEEVTITARRVVTFRAGNKLRKKIASQNG